jgi:hypothetical protein
MGAHRILWTCASIITCCYAWCPVGWCSISWIRVVLHSSCMTDILDIWNCFFFFLQLHIYQLADIWNCFFVCVQVTELEREKCPPLLRGLKNSQSIVATCMKECTQCPTSTGSSAISCKHPHKCPTIYYCVLILETFIMTMYEILSLISTEWDVSYYDYGWDFCDVIDKSMNLNIVMWLCVRCFMWKYVVLYICYDVECGVK